MTYLKYTQQALSRYNIPRLKRIAIELGVTPTGDKRAAETWINAIITYQSTQLQKVADEQALAQAELDNYIVDQAQTIAPEPLTPIEISFSHHEYYAGNQLIASISHDDNHLTQRWVVMVNGKELFRANTLMRCDRFICTHYKDGTLPEQEQLATPCTIENRIMAHIFNECQNYGFEILDDGIYHNNGVKLGKVGCTDGNWWVIKGSSGQQQYSNSVFDAVRRLCPSQTSLSMAQEATVQGAGSMEEQFSNEIMAEIFSECEKFGFEILDDGIYNCDRKLGEVGQTDGGWWFTRAVDQTQSIPCDSAMDAVWRLSMVDVSTDGKSIFDEYFLEQPLEQLTGDKLQRLLERAELITA
ncbi:hypothetical protein [Nostoc favosum]|uniref:SAP domain-containing protein n=1 Tax=Nostoc favosum CHAB5714 TaxID=2780399 RepID=A0ABS8IK36_9NOSO|nr:hypothetical protein [Nostoc favosum]MCC5604138.1 hypothetical protein [Nostoc favosum CHAB5714]